jgi:pyrimidine operon attenuation protein/uracil phosphoribosyltransferase
MRRQIMSGGDVERALRRIAHEVIERNKGIDNLVLVGIADGGWWVAKELASHLKAFSGTSVKCFPVFVDGFRDDQPRGSVVRELPPELGSLTGTTVILVDDVLQSGRTVRASIEAVLTSSRPRKVQLAVLVDRGHRELPIRADYVGKSLPTRIDEYVDAGIGGVVLVTEEEQ